MVCTSIYPVLVTDDVASAAGFFRRYFDFSVTFESDWYVSLRRDAWELAVLDANHESLPAAARGRTAGGLLVNVEVDDVDAQYRRLVEGEGLAVALPLRSEAFGQRHFILEGPGDVLVDVITPIEPEPAFAAGFGDPGSR